MNGMNHIDSMYGIYNMYIILYIILKLNPIRGSLGLIMSCLQIKMIKLL